MISLRANATSMTRCIRRGPSRRVGGTIAPGGCPADAAATTRRVRSRFVGRGGCRIWKSPDRAAPAPSPTGSRRDRDSQRLPGGCGSHERISRRPASWHSPSRCRLGGSTSPPDPPRCRALPLARLRLRQSTWMASSSPAHDGKASGSTATVSGPEDRALLLGLFMRFRVDEGETEITTAVSHEDIFPAEHPDYIERLRPPRNIGWPSRTFSCLQDTATPTLLAGLG